MLGHFSYSHNPGMLPFCSASFSHTYETLRSLGHMTQTFLLRLSLVVVASVMLTTSRHPGPLLVCGGAFPTHS